MNIRNSCESTNLMLLFWAKAQVLLGSLEPRPKVRGNSKIILAILQNSGLASKMIMILKWR
jgi:hypothetical protein